MAQLYTIFASVRIELLIKFFKTHPTPGAERTIKQVAEQIEIKALWKKRAIKEVEKFFVLKR